MPYLEWSMTEIRLQAGKSFRFAEASLSAKEKWAGYPSPQETVDARSWRYSLPDQRCSHQICPMQEHRASESSSPLSSLDCLSQLWQHLLWNKTVIAVSPCHLLQPTLQHSRTAVWTICCAGVIRAMLSDNLLPASKGEKRHSFDQLGQMLATFLILKTFWDTLEADAECIFLPAEENIL